MRENKRIRDREIERESDGDGDREGITNENMLADKWIFGYLSYPKTYNNNVEMTRT